MATTMHVDDPEDGVEIDKLSYVQVLSKMETMIHLLKLKLLNFHLR